MKSYSDLLRDPRWQKKRLEILQRDKFECCNCGEKDKMLHVHHCYYIYGNNPWDYESVSLVTLCEDCHEYETENSKQAKAKLIQDLCSIGFISSDFESLSYDIHEEKNKLGAVGVANKIYSSVMEIVRQ